jgi:hypothetical protein
LGKGLRGIEGQGEIIGIWRRSWRKVGVQRIDSEYSIVSDTIIIGIPPGEDTVLEATMHAQKALPWVGCKTPVI